MGPSFVFVWRAHSEICSSNYSWDIKRLLWQASAFQSLFIKGFNFTNVVNSLVHPNVCTIQSQTKPGGQAWICSADDIRAGYCKTWTWLAGSIWGVCHTRCCMLIEHIKWSFAFMEGRRRRRVSTWRNLALSSGRLVFSCAAGALTPHLHFVAQWHTAEHTSCESFEVHDSKQIVYDHT